MKKKYIDFYNMKNELFTSDFWINKLDKNETILNSNQISELNRRYEKETNKLFEFEKNRENIEKDILEKEIKNLIQPIKNMYHFYKKESEVELNPKEISLLEENFSLEDLKDLNEIRYGVTTNRAVLKTIPTDNKIYNNNHRELDRTIGTGVSPIEAVKIYHESKDEKWFFIRTSNYKGWIKKTKIALCSKEKWNEFKNLKEFLIIKEAQYKLNIDDKEIDFSMGDRIPLLEEKNKSYRILIPIRDDLGLLKSLTAEIKKESKINRGYLELNKKNYLNQVFKFLDEPYSWGGTSGRDCSKLPLDTLKSMGVHLPRDASFQASENIGIGISLKNSSIEEKKDIIKKLSPLSILYAPSHVMLYIGDINGEPYIIHDVFFVIYDDENGIRHKERVESVSVTPLFPLFHDDENTYLDDIYMVQNLTSLN